MKSPSSARIAAALALLATLPVFASIDATLTTDTTEGVATRADLHPSALASQPVTLHLALKGDASGQANVTLSAEDIFDQPVDWKDSESLSLAADGTAAKDIPFAPPGPGYFRITAKITAGDAHATASTDFGIIPPPYPGIRPDSFFCSNTAEFKKGADLELFKDVGMKIERITFYPRFKGPAPSTLPPGQVPQMDFTRQDADFAEVKAHDLWVMPLMGYAIPGDIAPLGDQLGMYGPPRDNQRFGNTWAAILQHYPEITTVEIWNEPWIFGWTWAGTPTQYDAMQKALCEALLKVNPRMRIVAGSSSTFIADNVAPDPSCWKGLLAGVAQHPYTMNIEEANARPGDQFRFIDETPVLCRQLGIPFAYVTEGGTQYSTDETPINAVKAQIQALSPEDQAGPQGKALKAKVLALIKDQSRFDNIENATRIVQYFVLSALDGNFQGNAQWQYGYGAGWTRPNVAFATLTHFLEDRPVVADIWPANELIWGGIFANPKFVTDAVRQLPRASELSVRWNVPVPADRADDKTKVAVLWSLTGQSTSKLDQNGTITLDASPDLHGYDISGREIPAVNGKLVLPFNAAPVYVTSDALDVIGLRDRVAKAQISQVTPVNFYAESLRDSADKPQNLTVRVENQLNVPVQGTLTLKLKDSGKETTAPFSIDASKLTEIQVPWPGATISANNQYGVTISASVTTDPAAAPVVVNRDQLIAQATFVKRTIPIDGNLDAWKGITPVLIDSNLFDSKIDMSQYLLNPGMQAPTGDASHKRIVGRIYTAYDDDNVYIAAAVNQDTYKCTAGDPVIKGRRAKKVTLPYLNGMPGGLNHAVFAGDVFEIAFGFRDRVPGLGRQMDDPYAWKGSIEDTDYNYVAHSSTQGDQLIRLWSPKTSHRNGYQTEAVPGLESVPGGKIKIVRDEDKKLTIYELAIPRSELALFDPSAGRCRFSFILYNGPDLNSGNGHGLNWSDASGVFDYWRDIGSFAPTWIQHTACQSFFGIQ